MPTRFAQPAADAFRGLLHRLEPDFTKPLLQVPEESALRLRRRLAFLYGAEREEGVYREVERVMRVHAAHGTDEIREAERSVDPRRRFTERDAVLITYGDLVTSETRAPLRTLADF